MELYWIAGIFIIILIPLVIKISQMPADKFFRRKRPVVPPPPKVMDWEAIAKRWEKNNTVLTNEIETLKKERKSFVDQIEDLRKVINEQIEQLAREKAWREKEEVMVAKVRNTDHELKDELRKAQQQLDEEHTIKLKVDIELQEFKIVNSRLKEEVRALTVKTLAMEKQSEISSKEIRDLRNANTELKKQKEDVKWIAKSDYDAVVFKLKKTESELGRLTRDQKNERDAFQAEPAAKAQNDSPSFEIAPTEPSSALSPEPPAPVDEAAANENAGTQTASGESAPLESPQAATEAADNASNTISENQAGTLEAAPPAMEQEPTASPEVPLSVTPEERSPAVETPPVVSAEETTPNNTVIQTEAVEGDQKSDPQGQAGPSEEDQQKNPGPPTKPAEDSKEESPAPPAEEGDPKKNPGPQ